MIILFGLEEGKEIVMAKYSSDRSLTDKSLKKRFMGKWYKLYKATYDYDIAVNTKKSLHKEGYKSRITSVGNYHQVWYRK